MLRTVSAADANRQFSRILGCVRSGQRFLVTSHGRPVAKLVPVDESDRVASRARSTLLARLTSAPVVTIGKWTRDELYERA